MATAEELAACKAYMRAEEETDEAIAPFYDAAVSYLAGTGIQKPETEDSRYTLAVHGLTLYYYDHRDDVEGSVAPFPIGLRPVINQLKLEGGCL